ncbi:4Fe-4S binding protein [Tistlia consotensis]|uniref:4Fe-4S binding domain-containing protein n=1 Tax=Tistlia consotensis USBA 355 TaxID=560819 RepID=A0A1Y6BTH2_9PROT|nr:4Fe-4S binding protein [Tistlia consotensis]SMF26635.1 4Fe-4S binding domain-containing protein [Tistlia consotensis USBA 355]
MAVRPHLPFVHAAMFVGFTMLVAGPVVLPASEFAAALGDAARTLIWTLWFPLVFLSVLLTGRSWCGVLCPMGAASEWMNRIGPKRPVPGWLRWEGTPIVSFLLVTILGHTVGVRDYPSAILEIFGTTLLAALVVGFFYGQGRKKRVWCRHVCPIGLLLGVFSRLGAVDLVPKRLKPDGDGYDSRGLCPTMIDLGRKTESRHCVMCARCVHPEKRGGLALRFRAPGAEVADIARHHPSPSEIWFLFLGTGVSLGGFLWLVLPEYQGLRFALVSWIIDNGYTWLGEPGPAWLVSVHPEAREVFTWLDFFLISGWMVAVMLSLTAVLAVLQAAAAWLAGRLGAAGGFRERFVALSYQLTPPAMVSLLLGLGIDLFKLVPAGAAAPVKIAALAIAVAWGAWLGRRILGRMGLAGSRAALAMVPGLAAGLSVAAAWWPAVVG